MLKLHQLQITYAACWKLQSIQRSGVFFISRHINFHMPGIWYIFNEQIQKQDCDEEAAIVDQTFETFFFQIINSSLSTTFSPIVMMCD